MSHMWSANNTNKIKLHCQHYSWPGSLVSLEIINSVACVSALPVTSKNITPVYKHIEGYLETQVIFSVGSKVQLQQFN